MRPSYLVSVAVLVGGIVIGVSWHGIHPHDRPIEDFQCVLPDLHQKSVAAPSHQFASAKIETNPLADSFPELWNAQTLSPKTTYGTVDNKTDSLLQIVQAPLVAYDSVFATTNSDRTKLPTAGNLLLIVERGKNELLREARVLSCMRMPPKTEASVQVVRPRWQDESYIVFVDKVHEGLKFRIGVIDPKLGSPEVLEKLLSNRSTEWPNLLRMISETQEPIPFPADGSRMINVNADESQAGHHLTIEVRDGTHLTCQPEPDVRLCYTFETNEWSSDISQIPEPPWKLEPDGTEVVAVLPITRPHQVAGQPSSVRPRCLAVVRQDYRSRRPWQDYSLWKTREAIWVVECGPECDLKDAVGIGVIHPGMNFPGAERACLHNSNARLIFQPELGRYFLVRGSRLYQLDLDSPMSGKPLLLAENPKDWPTPLKMFDEARLPYNAWYGAGGGSNHHYEGLHSRCGFPLRGTLDIGIVMATARPSHSDEPIEFQYGYNFKTKATTATTWRRTELKISSEHLDTPPPTAPTEARTCELVAGSTRVLQVVPFFQKRCLVAAEQTYRFPPRAHDAAESFGRVLWILDCTSDCDLKTGIPLGVLYPITSQTEPFEHIVLNETLGGHGALMALAEIANSQLRIRLFLGETYHRPLKCEALVLPKDPREWPPQMAPVSELRTVAQENQQVDFLSMLSQRNGFNNDVRVTIGIAGRKTNDSAYCWDGTKDSWTKVVFEPETSYKYRPQ